MLIINAAFIPSIDRKSGEGECVVQAIEKGHIHFPNYPSTLPRTGGYHAGHIKAKLIAMDVIQPLLCLLGFCSVTASSNDAWIQ